MRRFIKELLTWILGPPLGLLLAAGLGVPNPEHLVPAIANLGMLCLPTVVLDAFLSGMIPYERVYEERKGDAPDVLVRGGRSMFEPKTIDKQPTKLASYALRNMSDRERERLDQSLSRLEK